NAFDINAYFADKAAKDGVTVEEVKADFLAAGVDPIWHATAYAEAEGLEPKPVSGTPSTLTEALAILAEGGELPEGYTLSDTALVLEAGTIAAIGEQIAAAQDVVDGAANAEELEFAPEFAI